MNAVNNDYDGKEMTQNEACQGYVFNQLDESQVEGYLRKRYGTKLKMDVISTVTVKYFD